MPKKQDEKRPVWVQVLLDKSITPTARLIFSYLYWRQGLNGSCWPSQEMIAEDLGLTRRPIQKLTKQLEQKGYLRIIRPTGRGRGQYLRYAIITQKKGRSQCALISKKKALEKRPSMQKGRSKRQKKGARNDTITLRVNTKSVGQHTKDKKPVSEKSLLPGFQTEDKSTKKREVFKPPTSAEVQAYAETQNYYRLDAEQFVDYYQAKGWMIGKNKMKDWQAAVRLWKRRDEKAGKKTGPLERGEPGWLPTEQEADELMRGSRVVK